MAIQHSVKKCPTCQSKTTHVRNGPNHILHLLITVLTCTAWASVWVFLSFFSGFWTCDYCKKINGPERTKRIVGGVLSVLIALALPIGVLSLAVSSGTQGAREQDRTQQESTEDPTATDTPAETDSPTPTGTDNEPESETGEPDPDPAASTQTGEDGTAPALEAEADPEASTQKFGTLRTWTSADGQFEIEAEYRGTSFGEVRLQKPDGEEIKVSIEQLSEADQKWLSP
jgi:hypothetical protein